MKPLIFLVILGLCTPVSAQDKTAMDPADLIEKVLTEGTAFLDPSDMLAWVDLPRSVKKGDRLTLKISVENARQQGAFMLESVDLDGSFLQGFRIESISPTPDDADDSLDTLMLEYPMQIAAGETVDFVLEMIAIEAGVYVGEVSIWDEEDFLSRYLQCKVVE